MHIATPMLAALMVAGAAAAQTVVETHEIKVTRDSSDRAPTDAEELSLAALEGLMAQTPERALPILKKVLAGTQTTLVKHRALFVLSQIDSPEAREILTQTARSAD